MATEQTQEEIMAGYIERGLEIGGAAFVKENRHAYLQNFRGVIKSCALGFSLIGVIGDVWIATRVFNQKASLCCNRDQHEAVFAELTSLPIEIMHRVNSAAIDGLYADEIAKRLRNGTL